MKRGNDLFRLEKNHLGSGPTQDKDLEWSSHWGDIKVGVSYKIEEKGIINQKSGLGYSDIGLQIYHRDSTTS